MDIIVICFFLKEFSQCQQLLFSEKIGKEGDAVGHALLCKTDRHAKGWLTGKVGDGQLSSAKAWCNDHIKCLHGLIDTLHQDAAVPVRIDVFNGRYGPGRPKIIGPVKTGLPCHLVVQSCSGEGIKSSSRFCADDLTDDIKRINPIKSGLVFRSVHFFMPVGFLKVEFLKAPSGMPTPNMKLIATDMLITRLVDIP